jgi:membrane-bound ClpP family serine protease
LVTLAFLLITIGTVIVYGEFIWVGKLIFGIVGSLCVITGITMLSRTHPSLNALCLIALSIACFALESRFQTYWLAGTAATLFWAIAFCKLEVPWQLTLPLSMAFGALTIWLFSIAKQARRNKLQDL